MNDLARKAACKYHNAPLHILEQGIEAAITTATADKDREIVELRAALDSFHLRIYDAFTCPNCRGSMVQLPGFLAESNALVPCDYCEGHGHVEWARILERFDAMQPELAALKGKTFTEPRCTESSNQPTAKE